MYDDILQSGIAFLDEEQNTNGSYNSLSSPDPKRFVKSVTYRTTFTTALILSALNGLEKTTTVKKLQKKAAAFLLTQKSESWSFNYWTRNSPESLSMPYPDDLDDTFLALSALYEYDKTLFDGKTFAKIISLLTTLEVKEGGPYRTWLVDKKSPTVWKDVDIAVNSNIAYFLNLQGIELPNITKYTSTLIKKNQISSPYYYTIFPIIYFISRFYQGKEKEILINALNKKRISGGNALHHALKVLSLLQLGLTSENIANNISAIISLQNKGNWQPYGFYIDPAIKGKKHYAGASALTTVFCLLALHKYRSNTDHTAIYTKTNSFEKKLFQGIVTNVSLKFASVEKSVGSEAMKVIDALVSGDNGRQITLLPYAVAKNIGNKKEVPYELLVQLGSASLYGWIAYTCYDNFLDDEGDKRTLPIANIALRELTILFASILKDYKGFLGLFQKTMDELEAANLWEVAHCRIAINGSKVEITASDIPDYENYKYLADRSMGHALASVAVLFYLGFKESSSEVKSLMAFFRHYIIAKQLNDDAHDFEDDLRKGHVNSVAAGILIKLVNRKKQLPKTLSKVIQLTHNYFWKVEVVAVSHEILQHTQLARKKISKNMPFTTTAFFEKLLTEVENSAKKALEEHSNVAKFLETF